ncbi:porin [Bradyrhizobium sp. AZCC 2262]
MPAQSAAIWDRRGLAARPVLLAVGLCVFGSPAYSQTGEGKTSSCPGNYDLRVGSQSHLLGDWCGERTRLEQRGVVFDFQYVSDTFGGFKTQQNSKFDSWGRFRATVDVDFGKLSGEDGLYFHATGLSQGGGNMGVDLGLLTGPSSLVSFGTTRLDSWWIEKRWLDDRIAVRVGQFAGQDFYGNAQYGESFINGPMGYALGNLGTTFETANPFATPAAEIRIVPIDHLYLKSMVMAGDPSPLTSNPTGLVPTFRGDPVLVSEIGFTPGRNATSGTVDNVESRKGYSGLYQFGVAYNPGDFTAPLSPTPVSGNYLLYWKASQALWRIDPKEALGLDAIFAIDWSPPNVNRNFMQLTAGLRFNEPLPLGFHNSISLGYVRNSLSSDFLPPGMVPWKIEHGVELNVLLNYGPFLVQPVVQYYANVGGIGGRAVVAGLRTKIDF